MYIKREESPPLLKLNNTPPQEYYFSAELNQFSTTNLQHKYLNYVSLQRIWTFHA